MEEEEEEKKAKGKERGELDKRATLNTRTPRLTVEARLLSAASALLLTRPQQVLSPHHPLLHVLLPASQTWKQSTSSEPRAKLALKRAPP